MPVDPEFIQEIPYTAEAFMIDEILEINEEENLVRVRMPTHDDLPLTRTQRVDPVIHPRHVSGALMIHMTGMAAFVHAYYLQGLRFSDGWAGYGVRIYNARFNKLAPPGEPIEITCRAKRTVRWTDRILTRYIYEFKQGEQLVYNSEQSAMWVRGGISPEPS